MKAKPLLLGLIFFMISFFLGVGAMYYKSPKLMMDEEFSLKRGSLKVFSISPPPMNALYYNISCSSAEPLEVSMSFLNRESDVITVVKFTGDGRINSGDYRYFTEEPCNVSLSLLRANEASCHLKLYYPSFNEEALLLMVIAQLITSLLAISLIFSYYLKMRRGK